MICVTTTPGRNYLSATIQDIDSSAKTKNKIIIYDGVNVNLETPEGWRIVQFKKPQLSPTGSYPHNKYAMWKAFELAVEANEDLIFFEDDIELCNNAASFIEEFEVPVHLGWLTFFKPLLNLNLSNVIKDLPASSFVFSQALKFPLRTCKILHDNYKRMHTKYMYGGSDEILNLLGIELVLTYGVFLPNLIQHIGVESIVGNGALTDSRISKSYPGKDFDCSLLNNYGR